MAEVDTSIYNKLSAPPNPLASMEGVATLQNNMNVNQMFQQQQAAGKLLGQFTGDDGSVNDIPGLAKAAGGNPLTAPMAGQIVQHALQMGREKTALTAEQKQLHAGAMLGHIDTVLNDPDLNDPQTTAEAMKRGIANAMSDPSTKDSIELHQAMDFLNKVTDDPKQNRQLLLTSGAGLGSFIGKVEQYRPNPQMVDVGGKKVMVDMNPNTNPGVRNMQMPNTLPPTATTFNKETNTPEYVGGADQGGGAAGSSGGGGGLGSGRISAGPPLGAEAAASTAAAKSAGSMSSALDSSAQYPQRIFQLTNALSHLQKLGATGPGTEAKNYFQSFLLAQSPGDLGKYLPGVDPQKISDYNSANKYLTQFAQARAQGFGGGTDAELATTLSSTPNVKNMDKLTNVELVKANIALENMEQAATLSAVREGVKPEDYQKFKAEWGNSVDPRAFAIDLMPKAKQAALVKSLSPTERAKFAKGLREMKANNITVPNQEQLSAE